jgi:hypothetical protein
MFTALPLAAAALGLLTFGVIRGVSDPGPASGERLAIAIDPPVDAAQLAMAHHVVSNRVEERGAETRVVRAGDGYVVELGTDSTEIVDSCVALIERTAPLELHALDTASAWPSKVAARAANDPVAQALGIRVEDGTLVAEGGELAVEEVEPTDCFGGRPLPDKRTCSVTGDRALARYVERTAKADPSLAPPEDRLVVSGRPGEERDWHLYVLEPDVVLDGRAIRSARLELHGLQLELSTPPKGIRPGVPVAFVLESHVAGVATAARVMSQLLAVETSGRDDDAAFAAAHHLRDVVEIGALHPLHVVRREHFERATGFLPRAWPFLAIGAAFAIAAACVLLLRRR